MVGSCVPPDWFGSGAAGALGGGCCGDRVCAKAPAQTDVIKMHVDASSRVRNAMKTPFQGETKPDTL